jgi:[acyl-carrier-protein] S-malonyltransferase
MTIEKIALVFPGQGCQFVGMGKDLYDGYTEARAVYDMADDALGFPLSRLCFEGPAEELNDTANTQPAIYTTTMALWAVLAPRLEAVRDRVAYVAGHSLGEFSALAVAEAVSFEDGLRLVRRRGEAMRDAGQEAPGGMGVIIGMSDEEVAEIVSAANNGAAGVWIANYNSPGQVVIAGEQEPLDRALALAKDQGARRSLPLSVSVACHTPLMDQASQRLAAAIDDADLREPWVPVVSNAEARPLADPQAIKAALLRQLSSPVRWVESVEVMAEGGVKSLLEVGPRAVVTGLARRIDRSLTLHSVTNASEIESFGLEDLST